MLVRVLNFDFLAGHMQVVFTCSDIPGSKIIPVLETQEIPSSGAPVLEPGSQQGFGGSGCWCLQFSAVMSSVSWPVQWVC